jgi:hypothetical protein
MVVATALMGVAVAAVYAGLPEVASLDTKHGLDALAILVVCAGAGVAVYAGAGRAMGLEEPALLLRRVWGLLRRT